MNANGALVPASDSTMVAAVEQALVVGDLSKLNPEQRVGYYNHLCDSLGLNKLSKPFEYIVLNDKLTLYARKDCTDQLRKIQNVSVQIVTRELVNDVYVVTARATLPGGRADESIGAVVVANLKGENLANAMMKAETKSKRRVTLSIVGLGMLDETEVDSIPASAKAVAPEAVVVTENDEASAEEWEMCFGTATDLEAVEQMRTTFKSRPRSDALTLQVSKFYTAAKKRVAK